MEAKYTLHGSEQQQGVNGIMVVWSCVGESIPGTAEQDQLKLLSGMLDAGTMYLAK